MDLPLIRKLFYLLLLSLPSGLAADSIALPDIGDSAGAILSPEQERRIGTEIMRQIRQRFFLVEDPEVNEYVRSLGYRLAGHSDNPERGFTFFVINDPSINAFAFPGGFVGINAGLITASGSESELASVMAHEIAHVTQRHLARAYEAQSNLSIPALAGIIAAIIIGTQNSELGQATLAASQAGTLQAQLNFTRSNENEADFIGIQTLANAGFDPRAMPVFFERLQQASRYYSQPPEFLSTHPVTINRIANARDRAAKFPYQQLTSSLDYHLIREKLSLQHKKIPDKVKYYEKILQSGQYSNPIATRYGYALALGKAGQYTKAQAQLATLLKQDPERIHYLTARAQLHLDEGKTKQALAEFRKALSIYPNDHSLTLSYTRALLQINRARQARDLLHDYIRYRKPDVELYKLMALAEGDAGYPLEAHQSLAEYYYLSGQTRSAINQLDIALNLKSESFYELSKIQARRDEFKALDREEHK